MGVTMVHDLGTQSDAWTLYRRFGDEGRLTARIYAVAAGPEALTRIAPLRPTPWLYRDKLTLRAVRFFADGPLAGREAALLAPYADDASTSGRLLWNDAQIRNLMSRALMDGFQPALMATGDAAVRQAVDAYQELAATYGKDRRWRLEGALIADPADLARTPDYGIVTSLQPGAAIADRDMIAVRLGELRLAGVAALRTLAVARARLALGTSAPAGAPDPFLALHAAVTRQDRDSRPETGWRPEQSIDVRQAFAGLTTGAAYAAFAEDRVGTLEPGKWADFVLLDRDPFAIPASELWRVQVLTTFLAGEVVFKRGGAPADNASPPDASKETGDALP
jgi:predicted amidohydrolase YtcJ